MKIFTAIKLLFFFINYVFAPKGVHEFRFAFGLSYDFRSNEIFAKRVFHAFCFATSWTIQGAQEAFVETHGAI